MVAMQTPYASLVALSLAALLAPLAQAEPAAKMANGMLVNASGMTLYTFDKDVAGSHKSMCNGPCIALWPAVVAPADAKPEDDYSVVTRDDGSKQWAYKGKPLYTYTADKKAGDAMGDNFKDVWHVIK
jgi:predicted lipoprotein with Yx(FWY)xxD motif